MPPPIVNPPAFRSPTRGPDRPWWNFILFACVVSILPAYLFQIWLPGGIRLSFGTPWRLAAAILFVPGLFTFITGLVCLLPRRHADSYLRGFFRRSFIVLALWVGVVGYQCVRDALFTRRLVAEIQPWAQSILSRPASEVVASDTGRLKPDLIPSFVGPCHGAQFGAKEVVLVRGDRRRFDADGDYIQVFYGGGFIEAHGYIAGRKSLHLTERKGKLEKVRAGVYTFDYGP